MPEEEQISLFDWHEPETALKAVPATHAEISRNSQTPIPKGFYTDLEELTAHCQQCQRCDLAPSRTHVVVSRGNPQAPILIIGEGPGQHEDETGLPFVGRAGQLLDKILASVKLNAQQDAYICNIVKCRPPGNRTPTLDESAACKPYLLEQIRLVNPKIILLTGATAVRGLTGEKRGITKIRGQWLTWQTYLCMPIFHPAYLLRNPSSEPGKPKWLMWQDIQAVRAKLDELLSST